MAIAIVSNALYVTEYEGSPTDSVDLGAASADRIVLAFCHFLDGNAITGGTFNGVTATLLENSDDGSEGYRSATLMAVVPSGTGNQNCTINFASWGSGAGVIQYVVLTGAETTPLDYATTRLTAGPTPAAPVVLDTVAGGLILAAAGSNTSNSDTFAGSSETLTLTRYNDTLTGAVRTIFGVAEDVSTNPFTIDTAASAVLSAISFEPTATGGVDIAGSLFTNTQTFPAATVSPGPVALAGSLFTNTQTFPVAVVSPGSVTVAGSLFTNTQTFPVAAVSPGSVALAGSLFTNTQTFPAATVSLGSVAITGTLFTNGQTFYAATVTPGVVGIAGALFTNGQTFYDALVSQPGAAQDIAADLFTNSQVFFGASVSYVLVGDRFDNAQTFFGATIDTGPVDITGALFTNIQEFFRARIAPPPNEWQETSNPAGSWIDASNMINPWVNTTSEQWDA